MDRKSAIEELARLANQPMKQPNPAILKPEKTPAEILPEREKWVKGIENIITGFTDNICMESALKAVKWLSNRGINTDSILKYEIGYNPKDQFFNPELLGFSKDHKKIWIPEGIYIPVRDLDGVIRTVKIRRPVIQGQLDLDGKPARKYVQITGSTNWLYCPGGLRDKHIGYLFESELDALLANQAGFHAAYLSLPAGQNLKKDEYAEYFKDIDYLIICMDSDPEGQKAADKHLTIDRTIRADLFPGNVKDLGEFYQKTLSMDFILEWLLIQADKIPGGEPWI
jgi:DNA primase